MKIEFSVLMSLYIKESPKFLAACLQSLQSQTYPATEIIMVIDGPITQDLKMVIKSWEELLPLQIYPLNENVGLGKALNFGLSKCNYDLVARMDTDDICHPDRFQYQIQEFLNNHSLTICGSNILEIDPITEEIISKRIVPKYNDMILSLLPKRNPFNHMTVMYRKKSVENVGGYEHLHFMEDWLLWIKLLSIDKNKGANIQKNLVYARTGSAMLTRRSGAIYIHSEWLLHKKRIKYLKLNIIHSFYIFTIRAIPRLFPSFLLKIVYKIIRKV